MTVITAMDTHDVRFPTSRELDGSDAMNPDPDYSAAYVVLRTDDSAGLCGHGFVFTIGRGNEVQTAALAALRPFVVGRRVEDVVGDLGTFARSLTDDSQLRWLGPEKGVMHMAIGAVINAAWDMAGRRAGKPVWRLIGDIINRLPALLARAQEERSRRPLSVVRRDYEPPHPPPEVWKSSRQLC